MEDKNKKIAIVALIFALLALSQASAISPFVIHLIAGTGINITQSGDNYTISATAIGSNGSDTTKINKSGDTVSDIFILNSTDTIKLNAGVGYLQINNGISYVYNNAGIIEYNPWGDIFYIYRPLNISNGIDMQGTDIINCGNCIYQSDINDTIATVVDSKYVNKTGDTMTGGLTILDTYFRIDNTNHPYYDLTNTNNDSLLLTSQNDGDMLEFYRNGTLDMLNHNIINVGTVKTNTINTTGAYLTDSTHTIGTLSGNQDRFISFTDNAEYNGTHWIKINTSRGATLNQLEGGDTTTGNWSFSVFGSKASSNPITNWEIGLIIDSTRFQTWLPMVTSNTVTLSSLSGTGTRAACFDYTGKLVVSTNSTTNYKTC